MRLIDHVETLQNRLEDAEKVIDYLTKWQFATDGRKFDGNHKEVLKEILRVVSEYCKCWGLE